MGRFTNVLQKKKTKKVGDQQVAERKRGNGELTPVEHLGPQTPREAGVAKQVLFLPKTTIAKGDDLTLHEEQLVAKTEVAMLKGYRDAKMLAQLLQIAPAQAEKYVKRVYARWEVVGTAHDLKRVRGEGLSRMAMLERKYWQIIETSKDARAKIVALQSLMAINQQRDLLNGVTPKTMEAASSRTEGHDVQAKIAKQARLGAMAKQLSKMIAEAQQDQAVAPVDEAQTYEQEQDDDYDIAEQETCE